MAGRTKERKVKKVVNMMNQKELKEKYMSIIKTEVWQNDEHMQEYERKECEYVVEL